MHACRPSGRPRDGGRDGRDRSGTLGHFLQNSPAPKHVVIARIARGQHTCRSVEIFAGHGTLEIARLARAVRKLFWGFLDGWLRWTYLGWLVCRWRGIYIFKTFKNAELPVCSTTIIIVADHPCDPQKPSPSLAL